MTGECEFKRFCIQDTWRFGPLGGRAMRTPDYGMGVNITSSERAIRRCPLCNKRLRLKAMFCVGGEFVCWDIPAHKPRVTRKPGPRRKSKQSGRGK